MAADKDTPLGRLIDRQIAVSGPLSFALYMQLCLTHTEHGYYCRDMPIGRGGDFVTAPEISQIFGETLGLWVALLGQQFSSNVFDLVELGPGRGTLMADLMRSLIRVAPDAKPNGPFLVEIGAGLKAEQARRLHAIDPVWLDAVSDLADHGPPLVIVANEFFDALPVHQYQKTENGWHERMIGLEAGNRIWGLDPTPIPDEALPEAARNAALHARFESRPSADAVMAVLAGKLERRGGALIVIDYGYKKSQTGDTIQAIAGHAYADPLARPGEADLTAHVDFEALTAAAKGLESWPVVGQGAFLMALGAAERATALKRANPSRAEAISADLARLTDPRQMGEVFKVLCISSRDLSPYPFSSAHDRDLRSITGQEGGRDRTEPRSDTGIDHGND